MNQTLLNVIKRLQDLEMLSSSWADAAFITSLKSILGDPEYMFAPTDDARAHKRRMTRAAQTYNWSANQAIRAFGYTMTGRAISWFENTHPEFSVDDDVISDDDALDDDLNAYSKRQFTRGDWRKLLVSFVSHYGTVDTCQASMKDFIKARQNWPKENDVDFANRVSDTILAIFGHPKNAPQSWLILSTMSKMRKPYQNIDLHSLADFAAFIAEVQRIQKDEDRLTDRYGIGNAQPGGNRPNWSRRGSQANWQGNSSNENIADTVANARPPASNRRSGDYRGGFSGRRGGSSFPQSQGDNADAQSSQQQQTQRNQAHQQGQSYYNSNAASTSGARPRSQPLPANQQPRASTSTGQAGFREGGVREGRHSRTNVPSKVVTIFRKTKKAVEETVEEAADSLARLPS